jgi:lipoprotein-anchoring transpeptidase ErfK/SrfK
VYKEPSDESKILHQRYRDELVHLYYQVTSPHGPQYNPIWFRVWGGYIHSAHIQLVNTHLNPITQAIPQSGQIAELTVPYTQTMRMIGKNRWEPLYTLYYESAHWVVGLDEGPDGEPWYRIKEAWSHLEYHAPATHLRLIPAEDIAPLSPNVPPEDKRIEVSIARQTLTAYEGDNIVLETKISSGQHYKPKGQKRWDTPAGTFNVFSKMPSKHMGDGRLTSDKEAYELPGVPWVCFFHEDGVATHGTYWHTNYGTVMSHGCVNMRTAEAKWIFRWTTPVSEPGDWERKGRGTRVIVS